MHAERSVLELTLLREHLVTRHGLLNRLEWLPRTGSTNDDMASRAMEGSDAWPDMSALVTEFQSQGKGRLERTWTAPPRSCLLSSLLLRPQTASGGWGWVGMMAGWAICRTLRDRGVDAWLKWPNDVVVLHHGFDSGDLGPVRKICGILSHFVSASGAAIVLGSGLNVDQRQEELPVETATSLWILGDHNVQREELFLAYIQYFAAIYRRFDSPRHDVAASVRQDIREVLYTLGQDLRIEFPQGQRLYGRALDLDEQGELIVRMQSGRTTRVASADIVHLRPAASFPGKGREF